MVDIFETLIAEGWVEYSTDHEEGGWAKRHFAKKTTSKFHCQCNERSPSISAMYSSFKMGHNSPFESWALGIKGEHQEGQWLDLNVYAISAEDFLRVKDSECDRLIRCWEAANQQC